MLDLSLQQLWLQELVWAQQMFSTDRELLLPPEHLSHRDVGKVLISRESSRQSWRWTEEFLHLEDCQQWLTVFINHLRFVYLVLPICPFEGFLVPQSMDLSPILVQLLWVGSWAPAGTFVFSPHFSTSVFFPIHVVCGENLRNTELTINVNQGCQKQQKHPRFKCVV